jgi:hypothetical protein
MTLAPPLFCSMLRIINYNSSYNNQFTFYSEDGGGQILRLEVLSKHFKQTEHEIHWHLADSLYFNEHIPHNYSSRQTLNSSQTEMDNLITFYNFLDLTSVGKGNTLVSLSRASNVIVIMGFGTMYFFWWQAATCCSVVLDQSWKRWEKVARRREVYESVPGVSWGLEENYLKQFQLSLFSFNQFPAGLWQKADDKKRKESNKVHPLYKRRKSFPEGRKVG